MEEKDMKKRMLSILLVAMMLFFGHSVYVYTAMVHVSYGYCGFGLGGKHTHQGNCYDG